jgi:hypothetical protein
MKPLTPLNEDGSIMFGGFCTPFDMAIAALAVGSLILSSSWSENYGLADENSASRCVCGYIYRERERSQSKTRTHTCWGVGVTYHFIL